MIYQEAFKKIQEARSILLLTHVNPDADTLGSALALYHQLRSMGKRCKVFNATQLPYNLDFLPGIEKVSKQIPKKYDLMISFDAGDFQRLGIEERGAFLINIDHHRSNTAYGDINLIEPDFAATAQVVYKLLRLNSLIPTKEAALCLYTALVDDCGFFKYESVDEEVFEMAGALCRCGVEPHYVAKQLTMREPLAKLRLIQRLLETLELYHKGRVGVIRLTQDMLKATGAAKEMADDALSMVRSLATVEVAVLLREEEDGRIKVSLRSKDLVDVSRIALTFGGGGHKNAAGFTDGEDMDGVLRELLEKLAKEKGIETKE